MVKEIDELVYTRFEQACEKGPENTALIYLGESFAYKKLKELVDRFATALHDLGVKDNDRVMLYTPNCPQFLIAFFAAQRLGAIPVPISPIYTRYEIEYMINDSGADTIVCQDTNFGYVTEVFEKTCLKRVIVVNLVDFLPLWKRAIGVLFDKAPHGAVSKDEGVYLFKDLIRNYPPHPPQVKINPREHLASILYTGGTTGFPKGVPNTHAAMVSAIGGYQKATEGYVKECGDRLIIVNPLFHLMAQQAIMALGLNRGNLTVLMPVPQVDSVLEAIQKYKITLFLGVPTLYRMILENDRLGFYDLSSLLYCTCGGDVLPLEVFNRWKELCGVPIRQDYGCTEQGLTTLSPWDRDPVPGSIGFAIPSKEVKIVDPDTLDPVPLDTPGELLVTSDFQMTGYWNKPEDTAASFVEIEGKRWYRTKDFTRMDKEGQIYYVDRGADVIKYKGYRISASEIDAALQDHPAVIGACTIGVPDPKVGERIKAIVVLKEDVRGVGSSDLTKWCRERLAPYKIPQYIEFRDMLPKSKVGKLLRREIRDEERRRTEKEQR
jgi:long-chain acyl-CoA synthetase